MYVSTKKKQNNNKNKSLIYLSAYMRDWWMQIVTGIIFFMFVCPVNTCKRSPSPSLRSLNRDNKKNWYEWANAATAVQCGLDWLKSFSLSLLLPLSRHSFLCSVFWHFIHSFISSFFSTVRVSRLLYIEKRIKVWTGRLSFLFFFRSCTKAWTGREVTQITVDE
jgi:hypothetical protein